MPANIPHSDLENTSLEIFGLDQSAVETIKTETRGNQVFVHVTLKPERPPCPRCSEKNPRIYGYTIKAITHSILQGRNCTLLYHARRYRCQYCHRTYTEKNPFVFKQQRISTATVFDILYDLRDPGATFTSVARKHNLSPTSVQNIFDQHVAFSAATKLPRVMQIDESYSFRSADSKYVCLLLDYDSQKPVDLLPTRKKLDLNNYFRQFPKEEREKVKYIAADMYDVYYEVCRKWFPKAIYAIDRFHIMQEYNRKLTRVRVNLMKKYHNTDSDAYYLLKHKNHLLNIYPEKTVTGKNGKKYKLLDPANPRWPNDHFHKCMNDHDFLKMMLELSPDLETAYNLKNELGKFFYENKIESARHDLQTIINRLRASNIKELIEMAGTLEKWFDQIINSFLVVKVEYVTDHRTGKVNRVEHRLNSSMIENRNKIIKQIKHNSNGYTQWDRFRNRCLYVLTQDSPISLEPRKKDKSSE